MGKLIIVSNRLPVTIKNDYNEVEIEKSAGGLATGMSALHEQSNSLWVGWPGDVSRFNANGRVEIEKRLLDIRALPVYLTQTEIIRYYERFSNGVLWPLFHYSTDKIERDAWRNWKSYVKVNLKFAKTVASHYEPGDIVWVHDFQLALVPGLLRGMIEDAKIGFFLHIPFPSSEVFRILPWREEILRGMMGADLIGFHTSSYLHHFCRTLRHVFGLDLDNGIVRYGNRDVRIGVFPMGIDADCFNQLAEDADILAEVEAIRQKAGNRKLLLGIDRLDYTKGLARRMLTIERLFERNPALRNKIRLVQVVVPSRTKVDSYARLQKRLDETVGKINGAYSTVDAAPIHYLYRSFNKRQLVALYRAADCMLVTPLRDGMNLVAKEFVASRADEDGILILSEFAGAAAELTEAIQVNPYDLDRTASAIEHALAMPKAARRTRMQALRRRVQTNNCYLWADNFIRALKSEGTKVRSISQGFSSAEEIESVTQKIRDSERLLLLLDYDGTLVPFASKPELAVPDTNLKDLLRSLADRDHISVHLLSGRTRVELEQWFGDLPMGLHAEHGFWSRLRPGDSWSPLFNASFEWKEEVLPILESYVVSTPGALIEEKAIGFAWHYRLADPEQGRIQAEMLKLQIEEDLRDLPIEILSGAKVIEVRMRGVSKGVIASHLISLERINPTVLAMGDDTTDEDLFAVLPKEAFAVHIGLRASQARYRIKNWVSARRLLVGILDASLHIAGEPQIVAANGRA